MISAEDHARLHTLVHSYASLVDARAIDAAACLFLPEAILVGPAPPDNLNPCREIRGRGAVLDELSRVTRLDRTFHGIQGVLFSEGDSPDEATGEVRCEAHHVSSRSGEIRDHVWFVTYRDRYQRIADAWLFSERRITVDFIEDRVLAQSRVD